MFATLSSIFSTPGLTKGENVWASAAPQDKWCFEAFQELGSSTTTENKVILEKSDVVVVAVKPHIVQRALEEAKSKIDKRHLLVSIAMGTTLESLQSVK